MQKNYNIANLKVLLKNIYNNAVKINVFMNDRPQFIIKPVVVIIKNVVRKKMVRGYLIIFSF